MEPLETLRDNDMQRKTLHIYTSPRNTAYKPRKVTFSYIGVLISYNLGWEMCPQFKGVLVVGLLT